MKTLITLIGVCASLMLACGQGYIANLNGAQDGGGTRQGSGTVTLTLSGTSLTLNGSYSGLSANATAGHIHGPAAAGANAGVLYDLGTLGILTLGSTSGTYNGTLNLVALQSGAYTVAQQIADLNNGLWYLNIHDSVFPGGEIRGQILPVPEPSTLALFGLGTAGLLVLVRPRGGGRA